MKPVPRVRRWWIIFVSVVAILFVVTGYLAWLREGYKRLRFTTEDWLAAEDDVRGRMVDDLLKRHPLEGLGQGEVVTLLGQPDDVVTVDEMYKRRPDATPEDLQRWYGTPQPDRWLHARYRIGYRGARQILFAFDYSLHLMFRDGRVSRAYIDD